MSINIGHIHYANCTPIFTSLSSNFDCSCYNFVQGVPSRLNAMLRAGAIDVSPSSAFEYAQAHDQYCLLPELSISSIGAVKSVFLFSNVPIEDLNGARIGLSSESDTSVNLIKVLLAKRYGFANSFERNTLPVEEALKQYRALVVIGDSALRALSIRERYHVYDLGELWHQFTGLPFVFALWIVRRESAREKMAELRALGRDLVAAKEIAYQSYQQIAERCQEREWLGVPELVDYWHTLSYDLTPAHLDGARSFFGYAHEMGLIPTLPVIRFIEEEA